MPTGSLETVDVGFHLRQPGAMFERGRNHFTIWYDADSHPGLAEVVEATEAEGEYRSRLDDPVKNGCDFAVCGYTWCRVDSSNDPEVLIWARASTGGDVIVLDPLRKRFELVLLPRAMGPLVLYLTPRQLVTWRIVRIEDADDRPAYTVRRVSSRDSRRGDADEVMRHVLEREGVANEIIDGLFTQSVEASG